MNERREAPKRYRGRLRADKIVRLYPQNAKGDLYPGRLRVS